MMVSEWSDNFNWPYEPQRVDKGWFLMNFDGFWWFWRVRKIFFFRSRFPPTSGGPISALRWNFRMFRVSRTNYSVRRIDWDRLERFLTKLWRFPQLEENVLTFSNKYGVTIDLTTIYIIIDHESRHTRIKKRKIESI